jgi:Zn-dependent peptidase ImmA (M78 family)/DNA-binding XRE family transcriptional regulator
MKYFPERLKAARKMKGFSLQDLADVVKNKWNKQFINRLETGEAKPDSEILSTLCKVLGVTSDYFFRESTVSLEDIRFRKLKKLPAKEQEKVIQQTVEYLERYLELENLLGIDATLSFTPKSKKIKSAKDIESAALELRGNWGIGENTIFNVIERLEEHHIKVLPLIVDTAFSGMSTIIKDTIPVVVLNNSKEIPIVRKRFTALHELAHLYLDLSAFDEKESEKLCDAFAGAMLLPAEKLKQYFGNKRTQVIMKELYMIASDYGISLSAIMYRALNLEIISPSYHKFFMINYNRYKTKEKEFTVYSGKEESDRFLQLLIKAVAEEVISTTKAAALNNQKLGDFREILDNTAA